MLERVRVMGFRSIEAAELSLGKVNVLIGANGAGKSNLLGVFRMLNAMLAPGRGLQAFVAEAGRASALLFRGPKTTPQMHVQLSFRVDHARNTYTATWGAAADESLYFVTEVAAYRRDDGTKDDTLEFGTGHIESKLPGAVAHSKTARTVKWNLDRWRFYHFHDTSMLAPLRRASPKDDHRYFRGDGSNLPSFLLMLQEKHPAAYATILATVRQVAQFFDDFVLEPADDAEHKVRLGWREVGSDYPLYAHHLSDGLLRFIALATVLLQPDIPTRPLLVVIDEPELGLHPAAIQLASELVRDAAEKMQVLISTQSSSFVDCFAPEEIVVADRTPTGSQFRRLGPDALASWLKDYSLGQLWEKNVFGGRPGIVPAAEAR